MQDGDTPAFIDAMVERNTCSANELCFGESTLVAHLLFLFPQLVLRFEKKEASMETCMLLKNNTKQNA